MQKPIGQKPHLLKIIPPLEDSIIIKGDSISINNPWHFHPEIELLYCLKGKGTNFIGNFIGAIEEGEILLFGKNLQHTRQRDKEYYLLHPEETPETIVIQFKEDFLGSGFFKLKDFKHIGYLLSQSSYGIKFLGNTRLKVGEMLQQIKNLHGMHAILMLLRILDIMAQSEELVFLNSVKINSDIDEKASEKINKVYQYTTHNFRKPIALAEVASLTNHSKAAFCRYFKTHTRKNYFQYLIEIRIAFACELLAEGNQSINEVCFNSGFNNLSNFHKQFKKIVKSTPSLYQKHSRMKVPTQSRVA